MLYWLSKQNSSEKGFNIMVMIFQPQRRFPMFVSLQCWQLVSTEIWVSFLCGRLFPSSLGGGSHPTLEQEEVLQDSSRIKIYLCFTSSEAHPITTWNRTSQAISKRKFQPATHAFLLMIKSTSKAPNRPSTCLIFQALHTPAELPQLGLPVFQTHRDLSFSIVCVLNVASEPISPPPLHLRVLNSAFKNSTPSRKKSTQHLAALKESFQGLLLWQSWYSFPPILLVSLF